MDGAGRSCPERRLISSMQDIFKISVLGFESYAEATASVSLEVSAPRAWQRSRSVLTTVVRERWIRPSI